MRSTVEIAKALLAIYSMENATPPSAIVRRLAEAVVEAEFLISNWQDISEKYLFEKDAWLEKYTREKK